MKEKVFNAVKKVFTEFKENLKNKKLMILMLVEFLAMGLLILADYLAKIYIYQPIAEGGGDIILIKGVLRFTAVENTGASFGIFKDSTRALAVVSIVTVVVLFVVWLFTPRVRNFWYRAAIVLIIAGGLGNFIDRAALGYVRDFVYFELIDFAVFNLADSCLTVGTVLLLIYVIFSSSGAKEKKTDV